MSDFFKLRDRIYKFIETDISVEKSEKKYENLKTRISAVKDEYFKSEKENLIKMLDYHHQRHISGVLFDDFMKQEFPEPKIRVGRLVVDFNEENYDFMKKLAKNTQRTIHELTDLLWWNKYYPDSNVDLDTGEIIRINTSTQEGDDTINFSTIPNISKLKKLRYLRISKVTDEIIDFTKIATQSLYLKELHINRITETKKIILTGTINECDLYFVENLEALDCTRVDLLDSYQFSTYRCKNNGPCFITDAQKNHPSPFSKFKWKKELVTATTDEIDTLALGYNWDHGTKFLKWAIKQPQCDKRTALYIYWHGGPEWYSQFKSKKEVDSWAQDGYALLAAIEKRMKKDDFKTYNYKFNLNQHLNNKPINYPENKVREIPEYMFVND